MNEGRADDAERAERRRGLPEPPEEVRDPWKGLRGVMAGTLVLEFIVFGLALPVVWQLGSGASSVGFAVVAVLTVLQLCAAFVQRRRWGLGVALVLQLCMIACFLVHPAIGIMGLIFAGVWGYVLYLRHDVAKRMREGRLADQLGHPPGHPPQR
ncbi:MULTISPECIES: DUF4233 domain-containing protein [Actinopolyspora]|uniref:DUF4233 domain-containing protein n=1 Tax=Actinopolyspora saharensis TaxID=995062 RepID=A0A1H1DIH4_9ACTN|nr:DUF4233 domain-containing protein [Actinopolyspora saharensis]NHD18447.1 DUF4233 domain-containing protein [Actinopolyspora sp. BKK2]NHE77594.1 DUF4233 domain-containing protein [Actinopolyspora sp. BKK1]SDQ76283.1 Protein of unknown function [Actinopolyspora saharensis]